MRLDKQIEAFKAVCGAFDEGTLRAVNGRLVGGNIARAIEPDLPDAEDVIQTVASLGDKRAGR